MKTPGTATTADVVLELASAFAARIARLLENEPIESFVDRVNRIVQPDDEKIPIVSMTKPAERAVKTNGEKTNGKFRENRKIPPPKFKTDRKRIPRDLSPRLRAIMEVLVEAPRPITDEAIAKRLDMSIAAAHTALWRLRKRRLVDMLEPAPSAA